MTTAVITETRAIMMLMISVTAKDFSYLQACHLVSRINLQPWLPCPARVEKEKKRRKARYIITICKTRACCEPRLLKREREKERAREKYRERLGSRPFEPRTRGYFLPRKPRAAA
jgi:hypothetical protein